VSLSLRGNRAAEIGTKSAVDSIPTWRKSPLAGQQVYAPSHRAEWLAKLSQADVQRRAEFYYQQFDALAPLRQEAGTDSSIITLFRAVKDNERAVSGCRTAFMPAVFYIRMRHSRVPQ